MTANQDSDPTPPAGDHIVVGHITNAEGIAIGENARVEIKRYGDVIVRVDSLEDLPPTPGEAPYKGLTYYTEADEAIFFGREQLSDDLAARLQATPFLAVAGASGSGKSSLLRAGVVPRLRRRNWLTLVLTPTADPLGQLAAGLTRDEKELSAAEDLRVELAGNPRRYAGRAGSLSPGPGPNGCCSSSTSSRSCSPSATTSRRAGRSSRTYWPPHAPTAG